MENWRRDQEDSAVTLAGQPITAMKEDQIKSFELEIHIKF